MKTRQELIATIAEKARLMRKQAIEMALAAGANGAHLGPGFSMMEITATLYFGIMRHEPKRPDWPDRDRFVLSKGHGVLGYYTALSQAGYIPEEVIGRFETDDSPLPGHPCRNPQFGIEMSTGSLGHGLSIGVGMALAGKLDRKDYDVYVYLGDGECNEGMVWEAVMMAAKYQLDNLVAIVDRNRLQSDGLSHDIMDLDPPGRQVEILRLGCS